jgi:hypothetical protein
MNDQGPRTAFSDGCSGEEQVLARDRAMLKAIGEARDIRSHAELTSGPLARFAHPPGPPLVALVRDRR